MEEIKEQAKYCLSCVNKPCAVKGCPLNNDIPEFIKKIKEEKFEEAYRILLNTTVLPSICGRICPHLKQCEGSCTRGIKGNPVHIGELEAFIGDMAIKNNWKIEKKDIYKDKKVAIIGGGPTGLTAAAFLAREGVQVTIYDKNDKLGGILYKGIPEFRLDRDILEKSIEKVLNLGINCKLNVELEKDVFLDELKKEYDAILLAFGANKSSKLNINGEELEGVYGGNELLENDVFPDFRKKEIAIIGGGNVAIDVSRTVNKLGAKNVYVIYRRNRKNMPAEIKEIEEAEKEGVEFLFQNNILEINGEKKVESIELIKTELIKKEGEAREIPVNIDNSNYKKSIDYVIKAIGSETKIDLLKKLNLELDNKNYIKVDDSFKTSKEKVYAAGDLIGEKSTVAWAAKSGRNSASSILANLGTRP